MHVYKLLRNLYTGLEALVRNENKMGSCNSIRYWLMSPFIKSYWSNPCDDGKDHAGYLMSQFEVPDAGMHDLISSSQSWVPMSVKKWENQMFYVRRDRTSSTQILHIFTRHVDMQLKSWGHLPSYTDWCLSWMSALVVPNWFWWMFWN